MLVFGISLMAACRATAALQDSCVFRRDPWTMHDPGFPVKINVAPSQDELWMAQHAAHQEKEESEVLHVSSTVLDVSVAFPEGFSTDEAVVTMSLFEPSGGSTSDADFALVIDSQLQYVKQYRVELDPNKAGDRFVLRVYVETSAARVGGTEVEQGGAKLRAFYARWVDLSPTEPMLLSCEKQENDGSADEEQERVSVHPPTNMPPDLCSRYTMDGCVPVRKWYFDGQIGAERLYGEEYSAVAIESLVEEARKRVVGHSAADAFLFSALDKYPLKDKGVFSVDSSGRPWIESLCIAHEAGFDTITPTCRPSLPPSLATSVQQERAPSISTSSRQLRILTEQLHGSVHGVAPACLRAGTPCILRRGEGTHRAVDQHAGAPAHSWQLIRSARAIKR